MTEFKSFWKAEIAKDARSEAERLISIDDQIWDKLGFRSGGDADKRNTEYLMEVRSRVGGSVSQEACDVLEDENYHTLYQALRDLGKIHKSSVSKSAYEVGDKVKCDFEDDDVCVVTEVHSGEEYTVRNTVTGETMRAREGDLTRKSMEVKKASSADAIEWAVEKLNEGEDDKKVVDMVMKKFGLSSEEAIYVVHQANNTF